MKIAFDPTHTALYPYYCCPEHGGASLGGPLLHDTSSIRCDCESVIVIGPQGLEEIIRHAVAHGLDHACFRVSLRMVLEGAVTVFDQATAASVAPAA